MFCCGSKFTHNLYSHSCIENFEENEDDIGEVWFGEDVQTKVIDYITNNIGTFLWYSLKHEK